MDVDVVVVGVGAGLDLVLVLILRLVGGFVDTVLGAWDGDFGDLAMIVDVSGDGDGDGDVGGYSW